MPLLRSETQGRLLAELFLHPDREYSLRSLAKGVGVSPPTIQRDIDRLVKAAFLHEKRVGNSRLVRAATDHPVFGQIADIALFGYGPLAILPDILSRISGISDAFIFGSWAARYSDQAVGHAGDLDVAVIGNPPRRDLFQAAEQASRRLKIETNIQRVGPKQWEDEKDPFVASIRSSPRLQIRLFEEEAS